VEATATLLSRALDPAVQPPDDTTSERILDAALALCAASGVRHLTMDDVAGRAGVGRMTVYRRFGDRDTLVEALGVREARRCLARLDAAVDQSAPLADQVADGFLASMRIAREHPLLIRLARSEPEVVLAALTADDGAIFGLMRGWLTPRLGDEEAAELLVRLCVSFVLIQESVLPLDDERAARATARRMIAPMVTAMEAEG